MLLGACNDVLAVGADAVRATQAAWATMEETS